MRYDELMPIDASSQTTTPMPQQPTQPTATPWYESAANTMSSVADFMANLSTGLVGPATKESLEKGRQITRPLAGGAANIVDFPANAASLVSGLSSKATGGVTPTYEQMSNKLKEKLGFTFLPEAGGAKKAIQEAIPAMAPRNSSEQTIDNVASDIMGFMINPIGGMGKMSLGLATAMGISGEAASKLAETIKLPSWAQAGSKLFAHFAAGLIGNRWNLHGLDDALYANSREKAKGFAAEANSFKNKLENVKDFATRNKSSPGAKDILDKVEDAEKIFVPSIPGEDARINLQHAIDFTQNINRTLRETNLNKLATGHLISLKKDVFDAIEKSKSLYPEAFEAMQSAKDFHAAINTRNAISEAFNKSPKLKSFINHPATQKILGITGAGTAGTALIKDITTGSNILGKTALAGIPVAGALITADQLVRAMQFVITNPIAFNAWKNILKAGSFGHTAAMAKYVSKLDKLITKNDAQPRKGAMRYEALQPVGLPQ